MPLTRLVLDSYGHIRFHLCLLALEVPSTVSHVWPGHVHSAHGGSWRQYQRSFLHCDWQIGAMLAGSNQLATATPAVKNVGLKHYDD